MPVVSMKNIASNAAQNDARSRYTLVELGWFERDPQPFLQDVCIYDGEGVYTDTYARDKARRLAAKEAATA